MAAAYYPGTLAFVELPQGLYTFDAWAITLTADKADVSDFDRVASRFLPGATFGTITLSGPFSSDTSASPSGLGLISGNTYPVTLGLSDVVGIVVSVQVETCRLTQPVRDLARVEVTGVLNYDFLTAPDVVAIFDAQ